MVRAAAWNVGAVAFTDEECGTVWTVSSAGKETPYVDSALPRVGIRVARAESATSSCVREGSVCGGEGSLCSS